MIIWTPRPMEDGFKQLVFSLFIPILLPHRFKFMFSLLGFYCYVERVIVFQFNRRAMWKWMALVQFHFPCLCFLLDPISSKIQEFVSIASSWVSIAFGNLLKLKAYYPRPVMLSFYFYLLFSRCGV